MTPICSITREEAQGPMEKMPRIVLRLKLKSSNSKTHFVKFHTLTNSKGTAYENEVCCAMNCSKLNEW